MKKYAKRNRSLQIFVLVLYVISLLWLLFGMRITPGQAPDKSLPLEMRINLQPFQTVMRYINEIRYSPSAYDQFVAWYNLLGNFVLFIPLGHMLPKNFFLMRKFWKFLLFIMMAGVLVEMVQFFTYLGACDIDDWILNVVGAVSGWLYWRYKSK